MFKKLFGSGSAPSAGTEPPIMQPRMQFGRSKWGLEPCSYEFTGDDGSPILIHGWEPSEEGMEIQLNYDDEVAAFERGTKAKVLKVTGATNYFKPLQTDFFAAGRWLMLRPDPANKFDKNAVEVRSSDGKLLAGFVPKEKAGAISKKLRAGTRLDALVIQEYRNGAGKRIGIRLLAGEGLADKIALDTRPDD